MKLKAKGIEIDTNLEPVSIEFDNFEEFELFIEDINSKNTITTMAPKSMDKKEVESIINSEKFNVDWKSKFYYLSAEFQNYKKRQELEKSDIINSTKMKTLDKILDIENDISVAIQNLDEVGKNYLNPISKKLESGLNSLGLTKIQTENYDTDLHEVVSVIPGNGEEKIVSVVSNGWMLEGKVLKHPKVILSK
jgi:molecular chaperone GrpE (heat shock protein)